MKKMISMILSLSIILMIFMGLSIIDTNAATSSNWCWPTYNHSLKNDWPDYQGGGYHAGTDFPVPLNTEVYSTCDGEVISVLVHQGDYGKHIKIKAIVNGNVVFIRYAHLNNFSVSVGDKVKAGQIIGYSGSTGNSTGPHLHYEVRDSNDRYGYSSSPNLNPRNYLPGTSFTFTSYNYDNLPVDLGTDFYASITHIASWNHLTVEDNNNVDICWETYRDNQYWKFYRQYDGSYKIVSAKNDKCLDVANGSSDNGANIGVYENNDTYAQRWYIYKCGNGYQLKPKCSDCVMEMNAWNFYQGVNLVCGTKDNSDAEIFSINKRNFDELAETALNYSDNNGTITFSWDTPKCASNYNLKIYNGNSVWNGEAPINIWNVQGNSYNIELGEGTFTAVLQTYNAIQDYHECKSLTFTTNVSSYSPVKTVVSKGHIYELYDKPTSWETAKLVCENKDGHLATITSSEEEKVIESLIRYGKRTFYNVGATNLENVNEWKWITGESMSYTNWAIGEPNNVANIERYLSVFNNENYFAQWNDTTNASTSGVSNGFICEYDGLACDVDLDGLVSITDATLVQKYVSKLSALSDIQKDLADCDDDGDITIKDATYIQKIIVNLSI